MDINVYQRRHVVQKLHEHLDGLKGRTIALLGLAFKQDTDDMREAPSILIGDYLTSTGDRARLRSGGDGLGQARDALSRWLTTRMSL